MSNRVVVKDGTVLVTREECDRWLEDGPLRAEVLEAYRASPAAAKVNARAGFLVCTPGGYVVDQWQGSRWLRGDS